VWLSKRGKAGGIGGRGGETYLEKYRESREMLPSAGKKSRSCTRHVGGGDGGSEGNGGGKMQLEVGGRR